MADGKAHTGSFSEGANKDRRLNDAIHMEASFNTLLGATLKQWQLRKTETFRHNVPYKFSQFFFSFVLQINCFSIDIVKIMFPYYIAEYDILISRIAVFLEWSSKSPKTARVLLNKNDSLSCSQ